MTPWTEATFEAAVRDRIAHRDGTAVAALLLQDPLNRYAVGFNHAMAEVDAAYIERAYTGSLETLAAMTSDGRVGSWTQLLIDMSAVLCMTALHYRVKSYHAARPPVPRAGTDGTGPTLQSRPPTISNWAALGSVPSPLATDEPAADRPVRFRMLLAEARGLGRLSVRVIREVARYEQGMGTRHGAFRAVACAARCDRTGRVQWIGRWSVTVSTALDPPPAVVRQIRQLYATAAAARRAYFRGLLLHWPG